VIDAEGAAPLGRRRTIMSNQRERILARLAGGRAAAPPPASFAIRRFDWGPRELFQRFEERMTAVRGEVQRVGADWPTTLRALLAERGAANLLYGPGSETGDALEAGWPASEGPSLVPYAESVESFRAALFDSIDAGLTGCRGAIAETGTLVLWPDAREPRLLSLVPPIHVVLLHATAIRSTLAELIDEQGWARGMPTNVVLVSGPSKSADIEQTLAYGVHGPKELIVLVRQG
jgi:L-lactate dehydrogenase complex protein LldG